jgi:hypothetical protein
MPNSAQTTPATAPTGPAPPAGHGGRNVAVVVIVVVVLVVLGLGLTGRIPFPYKLGSSSSSAAATSSFSSAESSANSIANANSAYGGHWSLLIAEGINVISSYSNSTPGPTGCAVAGGTGTISFGAYSGNYSNGKLSNWLLIYGNSGGTSELGIAVSGTSASEIGTLTGSSCISGLGSLKAVPSSVEDSTQVASTLLGSAAVDAFTHNYSSANAQYTLVNTVSMGSVVGVWSVTYSGCPINGYGSGVATGGSVDAEVNASTGAIYSVTSSPSTTACPGTSHTTPIGTAWAVGNPVESTCPAARTYAAYGCLTGDYIYILSIETSTVTFSSVQFEVKTATGAVLTLAAGVGGFTVESLTGAIAAQGPATASATLAMTGPLGSYGASPICGGSACSGSTPLTPVYTIVIDVGTANSAGLGYTFVTLGIGAYSGTTSVTLP